MVSLYDLNLWNYNEPWAKRRELIAEDIHDKAPDLVALQEVRYDSSYAEDPRHQGEQLLARLPGYQMIWQPAMYYPSAEATRWEGLAILSCLPIVDRRHAWLSRDPEDPRDSHQRIVLAARVVTSRGPFWLFTTHLSLSARARERTVVEMYRFVRSVAAGEPFAVTGDLNARPDEPPIGFLIGAQMLEGQRGAWIDAWPSLHPAEPGYTWSAWEPSQRIDYLFVPQGVTVQEMRLAADRPNEEGVYPSDHLGFYAKLTW